MKYEPIVRDVVGLIGIVLMSAAGWLMHPVAGLGIAGVTLFSLSLAGALRRRKP